MRMKRWVRIRVARKPGVHRSMLRFFGLHACGGVEEYDRLVRLWERRSGREECLVSYGYEMRTTVQRLE